MTPEDIEGKIDAFEKLLHEHENRLAKLEKRNLAPETLPAC